MSLFFLNIPKLSPLVPYRGYAACVLLGVPTLSTIFFLTVGCKKATSRQDEQEVAPQPPYPLHPPIIHPLIIYPDVPPPPPPPVLAEEKQEHTGKFVDEFKKQLDSSSSDDDDYSCDLIFEESK